MSIWISKPCKCRSERQERRVLIGLREIADFNPKRSRVGLFIIIGLGLYGFVFWKVLNYGLGGRSEAIFGLFSVIAVITMLRLMPIVALGCPACRRLIHIKMAKYPPACWNPDRFPEPVCPNCGYLLKGVVEAKCPECGTNVPESWLDQSAT